MGTAAPGCPVERSSTSTAEKLLAPGVLKGHGFCGCGKTLGAESLERAWLQPCHPPTSPTQAPQGPTRSANPTNPIVILRQWSRARKRATPNEGSLYFPPRPGPSNIKRVAQS